MCGLWTDYMWHVSFFLKRTDCCFSPDDKLLVTGTSVKKEEGNGKLVFFDRASFQRVYEIEVTNAVSSPTISSTTTEQDVFQSVDMLCWLQTKTMHSGKKNTKQVHKVKNNETNMSFLLHINSLSSNKTAAFKCFYLVRAWNMTTVI